MAVPREVVIFGRTYHVGDVSPLHSSEGILGLAAYREGVIYLDPALDMALSLNTLWHEAVHIAQQDVLGTIDEAQARWISLFVHNFLVQNPAVIQCYLDDDESGQFPDE
jgi:hypothetical protein